MTVPPWETVESHPGADYQVFRSRLDRVRSPRSGEVATFVVLEAPDWVNVIALTPDRQAVLIRQFRHGIQEVTLEIPGGMMEPGETPEQAGLRELKEETGYVPGRYECLGWVHPNPAIQGNRCYTVLARDCTQQSAQKLDHHEDVQVELAPVESLPAMVGDGRITHALVVAAVHLFFGGKAAP